MQMRQIYEIEKFQPMKRKKNRKDADLQVKHPQRSLRLARTRRRNNRDEIVVDIFMALGVTFESLNCSGDVVIKDAALNDSTRHSQVRHYVLITRCAIRASHYLWKRSQTTLLQPKHTPRPDRDRTRTIFE